MMDQAGVQPAKEHTIAVLDDILNKHQTVHTQRNDKETMRGGDIPNDLVQKPAQHIDGFCFKGHLIETGEERNKQANTYTLQYRHQEAQNDQCRYAPRITLQQGHKPPADLQFFHHIAFKAGDNTTSAFVTHALMASPFSGINTV
jgi:hypothetical protein